MRSIPVKVETVVSWAMVSMAFVCLFSAGCKKRAPAEVQKPLASVITNRLNDAAYLDTLKQSRQDQMVKAAALRAVVAEMEACRERVKGLLPAGADDAALELALTKDETWQKLKAQCEQAQKEDLQTMEAAREKVRQRLADEAQAVKAVAEGKAKATDQTGGK